MGDLFKGCRDQNENQLALRFCPFYNVGRASRLIGWPMSFSLNAESTGRIKLKVEKMVMHMEWMGLSGSSVIEEVLVGQYAGRRD